MARRKRATEKPTTTGAPISAKALAAQLLLTTRQVRAWVRMGAPMTRDGRFKSVTAVENWLAGGGLAAGYICQVERSARGMAGPWGLFKREGWARAACGACDDGEVSPFPTRRRELLGDHVIARVERVARTARGPVPKVTIRCWCSARTIPPFPLAWIPPEQHEQIPVTEAALERMPVRV